MVFTACFFVMFGCGSVVLGIFSYLSDCRIGLRLSVSKKINVNIFYFRDLDIYADLSVLFNRKQVAFMYKYNVSLQ